MTLSENEPATFKFVAQCLKQLRPRVALLNIVNPKIKKNYPSIEDFPHFVCQFIHSLSAGTLMSPVPWQVL